MPSDVDDRRYQEKFEDDNSDTIFVSDIKGTL